MKHAAAHHALTPIRTRSSKAQHEDGCEEGSPSTPGLSFSDSTAPSSAASRPSRQVSWGIDDDEVVGGNDSMGTPRSLKWATGGEHDLDVDALLSQLQVSTVPHYPSTISEDKGVHLLERLGQGAHANIYRALYNGTPVAAKVANSASSQAFIRRECDVLDYICNTAEALDNIVEHHGCVQTANGKFALLLELGSSDLMSVLESSGKQYNTARGPVLGQTQWQAYAVQLATAVAAIHKIGLVHGDIKPQNVILSDDGLARLIDFESAFTLDGPLKPTCDARDIVGSNAYCAPELLRMGSAGPGLETDIFALGVTLLVLATGEEPYLQARTGIEQIIQSQAGDPIRYSAHRERLTPAIERIVRGCCAKIPARRWSAEQVLEELTLLVV